MKSQDLKSVPDVDLTELLNENSVTPIRRFTAKLARIRYSAWLIALREIAIYRHLIDNFEKLPPSFKEYKRIKFLHNSSIMRRLISAAEKKLQKRIY